MEIEATICRDEYGLWEAEIPFLGLAGGLGHTGRGLYRNTPWVALAQALASWEWWERRARNMHLSYADFCRQEMAKDKTP